MQGNSISWKVSLSDQKKSNISLPYVKLIFPQNFISFY